VELFYALVAISETLLGLTVI